MAVLHRQVVSSSDCDAVLWHGMPAMLCTCGLNATRPVHALSSSI
eukprot:CAMPEP_0115866948 /NCGR_PEP_ID=MMETSP0287-20121206/20516_1 /TAXON_ID=412157 /ORGANISM="Chrysochromulina rotalis, Strain UIO044" /LENGTH=44 /DNA_ID= /DNA_START= /DNA_END= /DNA_ORIENTATION=